MIRQEAILQSPLRILDREIRGGLGKGRLGAIVGAAGLGKSACLVQLGLDALLRQRSVLHVVAGRSVEQVSSRYDALFAELADRVALSDRGGVRELVVQRRLIWSSLDRPLGARALEEAVAAFQALLGYGPFTILVDGFDWQEPTAAATLAAIKASAAHAGAELWMTARAPTGAVSGPPPRSLAALPERCAALVDVGIVLAPQGRHATLTLVKDLDRRAPAPLRLVLEAGTLRPAREGEAPPAADVDSGAFTLLASGSAGAEEEFGICAERWGVREVNYTFPGRRELARTRGLVELSEDELRLGAVSPAYVRAHMNRVFSESAELQRVLQTIWHQVSTAGEVFSIGALNPDRTAHGGTGWAVELARHWGRPVHLFDQDRKGWLRWDGRDWVPEVPPVLTSERFAGAGTRALTPDGRAAIRGLYERSFGVAPG
jgi:hypothetical protein